MSGDWFELSNKGSVKRVDNGQKREKAEDVCVRTHLILPMESPLPIFGLHIVVSSNVSVCVCVCVCVRVDLR